MVSRNLLMMSKMSSCFFAKARQVSVLNKIGHLFLGLPKFTYIFSIENITGIIFM